MRVYSDLLKKPFDTAEELEKAEEEYKKAEEEKVESKKTLAKKVDVAQESVDKAYEELEQARAEVKKILDESNAKMNQIWDSAVNKVREAEHSKFKAIEEYNDKYGTYTVFYDSTKNKDLSKKIINRINNAFNILNWIW